MSQPHTRKSFFGRLAAIFAVSSLVPGLLAKTAVKATDSPAATGPFRLRPDERAIARREDSL